jgi:hypothetical protein
MTSQGHCLLTKWIEELEANIAEKLKILKKENFNFFENKENSDYLTNLAIELEAYLSENSNNIEKLLSQFCNIEEINKISPKDIGNFTNSENYFENKLFQAKPENITKIYEFYLAMFTGLNDKIINKLKQEYNIFNY